MKPSPGWLRFFWPAVIGSAAVMVVVAVVNRDRAAEAREAKENAAILRLADSYYGPDPTRPLPPGAPPSSYPTPSRFRR